MKIVIIGGGIAGLTAGIYLQKAGLETVIYEKNAVPGGECTGWKREGFTIDNCIHWLTGTKPGSGLYDLWREVGALEDGISLRKKEMFFSSELNGERITFWRDIERTRKELLELSPEDEKEINKLIDYTKMSESMTVPVEKPFDCMNPIDFLRLGLSMKEMSKVLKEYGGIDVNDMAERFHHPLIKKALTDYLTPGYQAYAFLVSYATVTSESGDIPEGGSLAMVERMVEKYRSCGGKLQTNTEVESVVLSGKKAEGVRLIDHSVEPADYVICACDTSFVFDQLLPKSAMPKVLRKLYDNREMYPVSSGFQVAFAVDGIYHEMSGTRMFSCDEFQIANSLIKRMSTNCYDYEPDFAPPGKMIVQSNFVQSEEDFEYWANLYQDRDAYVKEKKMLGEKALERLVHQYPFLKDQVHVLDVWTPYTYSRYCHAYKGSYMSFIITKNAKNAIVPGKIKGLKNVFLASQWQMGPGGLPTAASMGKFAAWRIMKKENRI